MQEIKSGGYSVFFEPSGYKALNDLLLAKNYSSIFVIVDENTGELCTPRFLPELATESRIEIIEIEAGEHMKTIETCSEIWQILNDLGADRKSVVINLGGGVISDLGGFIASTYKRGIDFINVPTSLLGMVDASIGGKNGVDLGMLKNQIGTITSPEMVVIDTGFLESLPENEMRSGMAEVLKHGLIADLGYWRYASSADLTPRELLGLIPGSVAIKNNIVMQDPTEDGIRKALNFGHTLGHAIESHFLQSEKPLLHGEAVACGMILECYISYKKNLLLREDYAEIKKTIKNIFADILFDQNDVSSILALLVHDKKNEYGKILFVLLDKIGSVCIDQAVENDLIIEAFADYKSDDIF